MRIVIDMDFDASGNKVAEHVVHTEIVNWNKCAHPDGVTGSVDVLTHLAFLDKNPALHAKAGWNVLSNHPSSAGKTRIEVFRAEIIRLNDVVARTALGV